jgi:hypothetical protein
MSATHCHKLLALLVFCAAAGCDPFWTGAGEWSDGGEAGLFVCAQSCVYQVRGIVSCDGSANPAPPWNTICADGVACNQVAEEQSQLAYDPLTCCSTQNQYQNLQSYPGPCSSLSPGALESPLELDGSSCSTNSDCQSDSCVSTDDVNWVCASLCDDAGACEAGFTCVEGYCLAACS